MMMNTYNRSSTKQKLQQNKNTTETLLILVVGDGAALGEGVRMVLAEDVANARAGHYGQRAAAHPRAE